jgi:hypothetical protein
MSISKKSQNKNIITLIDLLITSCLSIIIILGWFVYHNRIIIGYFNGRTIAETFVIIFILYGIIINLIYIFVYRDFSRIFHLTLAITFNLGLLISYFFLVLNSIGETYPSNTTTLFKIYFYVLFIFYPVTHIYLIYKSKNNLTQS